MTSVPVVDVIEALSILNGHARAFGVGKHAIYEYKTLASALAIAAGTATVQLRQWTGTCGHCRGTGRYVDSYGERWPHCRQCSSTGRVTLKFTEVSIADGPTWHHPFETSAGRDLAAIAGAAIWDGSGWGRWRDARGNEPVFWNITDGWAPRQPATRLDPDPLAAALNVVEAWALAVRVPIGDTFHWIHERALADMRRYVLDLGRLPGPCYRCGGEVVIGLGCSGPPFAFASPVCRAHERTEPAFWPRTVPDSALTPPLIEWRDRHVALRFDSRS